MDLNQATLNEFWVVLRPPHLHLRLSSFFLLAFSRLPPSLPDQGCPRENNFLTQNFTQQFGREKSFCLFSPLFSPSAASPCFLPPEFFLFESRVGHYQNLQLCTLPNFYIFYEFWFFCKIFPTSRSNMAVTEDFSALWHSWFNILCVWICLNFGQNLICFDSANN